MFHGSSPPYEIPIRIGMWNAQAITILPWWVIITFGFIVLSTILLRRAVTPAATNSDVCDQAELDAYLRATLSNPEIGKSYERYIGYLYERNGCAVKYHGVSQGYEDLGIDLIVQSGPQTLIVQTKCWAKQKQIRENYIYQLHGTLEHYKRNKKTADVRGIFFTTATYSQAAIDAARSLGIELKTEKLDRTYPMIKCIVSESNGDQTFYLPFDDGYDNIVIHTRKGDAFAQTIEDASALGFKRIRGIKRTA